MAEAKWLIFSFSPDEGNDYPFISQTGYDRPSGSYYVFGTGLTIMAVLIATMVTTGSNQQRALQTLECAVALSRAHGARQQNSLRVRARVCVWGSWTTGRWLLSTSG